MIKSIRDEFIGEQVEILYSDNKSLTGLKGVIVDETKNSFRIETKNPGKSPGKFRTILKNNNKFRIDGKEVDGRKIMKRPEDRIKLKIN